MDWIKVSVFTSAEGIEAVCGRLLTVGINGVEIEDNDDFLNFLEENRASWDYVDEELLKSKKAETRVSFYVSDNEAGRSQLTAAKSAIKALAELDPKKEFGRLELGYDSLCEEDWANNWKKYFKPLTVGESILICPEWETVEPAGKTVFKVNPGMSFGTGTHASTQLCIEELEKYIFKGATVLDLGCGSGILSIISFLLGAESAYAVDIDPNCVDIAYKNAEMNGIAAEKYHASAGNILCDEALLEGLCQRRYDIVLANIVADVIMPLGRLVPRFLKPGGVFITSGIITDRQEEVVSSLRESGFNVLGERTRGDWAAAALTITPNGIN